MYLIRIYRIIPNKRPPLFFHDGQLQELKEKFKVFRETNTKMQQKEANF